jgi:hypothetical protein
LNLAAAVVGVGLALLFGVGLIQRPELALPFSPVEGTLETIGRMRTGLQQGAGSSYGSGIDTGSIGGTLRFLPMGLAFLLFAPFPWRIESALQAAAMPEAMRWYPLFIFSLVGVRWVTKQKGGDWLIPACILLVVVTMCALVEGNFGTAYRHRAQIMPLFFVFASVGTARFVQWFKALGSRGKRPKARFAGPRRPPGRR